MASITSINERLEALRDAFWVAQADCINACNAGDEHAYLRAFERKAMILAEQRSLRLARRQLAAIQPTRIIPVR